MTPTITPCAWYASGAHAAAEHYIRALGCDRVVEKTPLVAVSELLGCRFVGIDGGPVFRPNPSVSLFTVLETEGAVEHAWEILSEGGEALMPLDRYPWSPRYGWVQDRYGVSWQISHGRVGDFGQAITPALMFTGEQFGRAEEAIAHYAAIFSDSGVHLLSRYDEADPAQGGRIQHAQFSLGGRRMIAMDSAHPHDFRFTEGMSLQVGCETQDEIDHYWRHLSDGGSEGRCGWLKDRFGLSWQVVPTVLADLMRDPARAERVTAAYLPMNKLDLATLLDA